MSLYCSKTAQPAETGEKEAVEKAGQRENTIKAKDTSLVWTPLLETRQAMSTSISKTNDKRPPSKVKSQKKQSRQAKNKSPKGEKLAPVIQKRILPASDYKPESSDYMKKKSGKQASSQWEKHRRENACFKTEMSASSQDGPQHGKSFPALKQGTIVTEQHVENGKKLKLKDGEIQ